MGLLLFYNKSTKAKEQPALEVRTEKGFFRCNRGAPEGAFCTKNKIINTKSACLCEMHGRRIFNRITFYRET